MLASCIVAKLTLNLLAVWKSRCRYCASFIKASELVNLLILIYCGLELANVRVLHD